MNGRVCAGSIAMLSLLTLLPVLSACVGHATRFLIQQERSLSSEKIAQLSTAIAENIKPLGMVQHPRLETIRKESEASAEYDFVVLDEWVRERGTTGDDVRVYVGKEKTDGAVFIAIQNRTWPRRTSFTDRLEEAIRSSLNESLPGQLITIRHGAHGIFLD